jgi:hypothetical protein
MVIPQISLPYETTGQFLQNLCILENLQCDYSLYFCIIINFVYMNSEVLILWPVYYLLALPSGPED